MQSDEIRSKFLKFFENHGHKIVPSSSLIPNDPSVLFTTAGMQQFKPYYTSPESADKDFGSRNIVTVQKCVRTGDIDEVGDATHLTFFEMLGNFSFGGYGKKKAIEYAHEFITKELGLHISYVTVFDGSVGLVEDKESTEIWKSLGIPKDKIIKQGIDDVFWGPTGDSGPCGPTTEIYCKNDAGEDVEIWNIVFNEFFSKTSREQAYISGWHLEDLQVSGIDTGMGFERLLTTVQNKKNVYETDLFEPIIKKITEHKPGGIPPVESWLHEKHLKSTRIIADHIRTSIFMIADGVVPSNTGRGYVLRRLIRRAVVHINDLNINMSPHWLVVIIGEQYRDIYPSILEQQNNIEKILNEEELKFAKTLASGLKEFDKMYQYYYDAIKLTGLSKPEEHIFMSGDDAFMLFSTYGFPIELTLELAKEKKFVKISETEKEFYKELKEHQKLSQTSSAGMFKGGLANHNEKTVKLHTAHHLLLAALKAVISPDIKQRGSNITEERLRMDFLCDHKLTDEEKKKVEDWVNDKIKEGLNVIRREMPLAEAEKVGAEMEFGTKYPDIVSVYFIEDKNGNPISKEFCGGPHVTNTKELGQFKIQKEEAVAHGIRRIKGVLV